MMKIGTDQLRTDTENRFHFSGTQEALGLQGVDTPLSNLDIKVHINEADHGYYLTGTLTGTAALVCHRCSADFDYQLDVALQSLIVTDQSQEFQGEDDVIMVPVQSREIDITKLVSDSILLDIPYKVLCQEDCKGLCAQCGTNLNEATCDCSQDAVDPRWARLQELNFEE